MLRHPDFLESVLALEHGALSATALDLWHGHLEERLSLDISVRQPLTVQCSIDAFIRHTFTCVPLFPQVDAVKMVCDAELVHALCAWVLGIRDATTAGRLSGTADRKAAAVDASDFVVKSEISENSKDERPETASDDGHGLALVLDPGEFEKRCHESAVRLRQFQWWRVCKHCTFMSPGLRQYQIDRLFAYVVSAHHQQNLVLLPEDDYLFPTATTENSTTLPAVENTMVYDQDDPRSSSAMSVRVRVAAPCSFVWASQNCAVHHDARSMQLTRNSYRSALVCCLFCLPQSGITTGCRFRRVISSGAVGGRGTTWSDDGRSLGDGGFRALRWHRRPVGIGGSRTRPSPPPYLW